MAPIHLIYGRCEESALCRPRQAPTPALAATRGSPYCSQPRVEISMHGPAHRHAFVKPPRAARRPTVATWHGVELVDDYAWLRADNWQDVMREPAVARPEIRAYLDAENAYCEAQLAETRAAAGRRCFAEMSGRLKEDDSSVPAPDGAVRLLHRASSPAASIRWSCRRAARRARPRRSCSTATSRPRASPTGSSAASSTAPTTAARLRQRRQGLGTLHHPHPRPRDRRGPARQHPRHARRRRLGERQPDAVLRPPRRQPPPAARLPPRRRHAGRGRRARL